MQLEATDLLLINRGGVNYKVTGAQLRDGGTVQPTDAIMVQRGSTLYKVTISTLTSSLGVLQDTDFILVQRGDEMFSLHPNLFPDFAPHIALTLRLSGLSISSTALQIEYEGARAPSGFKAQIQFPDSPRTDTVFLSGSGTQQFSVQDLGSGTVRARIYGAFDFINFRGSTALESLEQSAAGVFAAMVPTPNDDFGAQMFANCTRLISVPLDIPWKSLFTTFFECSAFNQDVSTFNVTGVKDFYGTFNTATIFNQDISSWDVSSATEMDFMFRKAQNFDQNLNAWGPGLSNVESFSNMFSGARDYNQPMNSWDVSGATPSSLPRPGLDQMFEDATSFNQDLTGWCVSNFVGLPYNFAKNSGLDQANYPVWGTCP